MGQQEEFHLLLLHLLNQILFLKFDLSVSILLLYGFNYTQFRPKKQYNDPKIGILPKIRAENPVDIPVSQRNPMQIAQKQPVGFCHSDGLFRLYMPFSAASAVVHNRDQPQKLQKGTRQ